MQKLHAIPSSGPYSWLPNGDRSELTNENAIFWWMDHSAKVMKYIDPVLGMDQN
jgi:hypothetical protein